MAKFRNDEKEVLTTSQKEELATGGVLSFVPRAGEMRELAKTSLKTLKRIARLIKETAFEGGTELFYSVSTMDEEALNLIISTFHAAGYKVEINEEEVDNYVSSIRTLKISW